MMRSPRQGLVDVVGDEDNGALFLFPDARGFFCMNIRVWASNCPKGSSRRA